MVLFSCDLNEKISTDSSIKLTFDTDIISFDTVYTQFKDGFQNITQRLTVYNPSKNVIIIASIGLQNDTNTAYSLIINGQKKNSIENFKILGKDSLLILISIAIATQNNNDPVLKENSIVFLTNGNTQQVILKGWGQDVNFLQNEVIECDAIWKPGQPYLVNDTIVIASGCTLNIKAGTHIHFGSNGILLVVGNLIVEGTTENPVIFTDMRLGAAFTKIRMESPYYATARWKGIFFLEGSSDNIIDGAIIRNGYVGIHLGTPDDDDEPDLILKNSIIENMFSTGIQCFTSDLLMENTLINNCVDRNVAFFSGGNYTLKHNTFGNYQHSFIRDLPSIAFTNYLKIEDAESNIIVLTDDLILNLDNNILWGNFDNEIEYLADGRKAFELNMNNNIIKTTDPFFDNGNNILNKDPKFISTFEQLFSLDTLSPAKDAGINTEINTDLKGEIRDNAPDIGAYERIK